MGNEHRLQLPCCRRGSSYRCACCLRSARRVRPGEVHGQGACREVALNRYAAAGALSASAAAGDPRYKELAQTIRRSQERHAQVFTFDTQVKKDLAKAREICLAL